jgi:hypothetical protein
MMTREYPRYVFVSPGPTTCNGGTYGCTLVKDEEEHAEALKAGFFSSLPEALRGEADPVDDAAADAADAAAAAAAADDTAAAAAAAADAADPVETETETEPAFIA